ncbi:XRE family transcriptional regulator [Staphylococcus xylosus]|uniref:Helix-turn-helix domain-containing protein n=2 Tax=Staphylococcus xylosus TaxID=1288 RepID=A0A5R9B4P7_STAXY|nr:XRE family transcriptional regulator [Staphylococcus xylosus]AID43125.1 Transcriptional regulator, MerR family, near polyamine transporter [Staphylococcus xylosus]MBE6179618.1 XRE family transcriptional regulator [Staphylococcus xylosus]MBG3873618.1 XRE family transcriptional regulator [Staphylococcus xylosus]MBM6637578.1 helix-turn-helix transcriptional regulator [Staphylococcus xylosus]MCE4993362.1 helix-turn-helix transcriptional regulator [Staphylococcus xylosus]
MDIGKKIKNLRIIKHLTQEELAERTDLSKGYISQIESQHASPSMETFLNILEVLGTTPSDFFKEARTEKVLYKKASQVTYDEYDKGYILNWPVTQSNEFEMEPLLLTLKGNASYKNFEPSESDTFIYCLKGQVTLKLGDDEHHAVVGDALYFKANQLHRLINPTSEEAQVMIVATASYL